MNFSALGCDGIFDVISTKQLCLMAKERISVHESLHKLSSEVIHTAMAKNSKDNLTGEAITRLKFISFLFRRKARLYQKLTIVNRQHPLNEYNSHYLIVTSGLHNKRLDRLAGGLQEVAL